MANIPAPSPEVDEKNEDESPAIAVIAIAGQ
jgi:hypothetical protein